MVGTIALVGRGSPWAALAGAATAIWAAYFYRLIGLTVTAKGSVLEVSDAMKKAFGWDANTIERRIAQLKRVALQAANHFDTYQKYRELGFDMALDSKGKLWLIEENTAPSHPLFKHLKSNLKMWRLIEYRYGLYSRALSGRK